MPEDKKRSKLPIHAQVMADEDDKITIEDITTKHPDINDFKLNADLEKIQKDYGLTDRYMNFAVQFVKTNNVREAYKNSCVYKLGGSVKTQREAGYRMLGKPGVATAIARIKQEIVRNTVFTKALVYDELWQLYYVARTRNLIKESTRILETIAKHISDDSLQERLEKVEEKVNAHITLMVPEDKRITTNETNDNEALEKREVNND